jgi:hypothetical protein
MTGDSSHIWNYREPERSDDPSDHIHRSNYNEYYGPRGW